MNCPICEAKLEVDGDMHEDGRETCPNKHYYYTHSYGAHEQHIDVFGDGMVVLSLGWHYAETADRTVARMKAESAFIQYAKALKNEG